MRRRGSSEGPEAHIAANRGFLHGASMSQFLISTLSGAKGRLITIAVAVATGFATKIAADHGLELTEKNEMLLASSVGALVGWFIDSAVLWINTRGIQRIQDALPPDIKSDGHAGDKTVEAVQEAVEQANS